MRILFAPFARQLRDQQPNPKSYPWPKEVVANLPDHEVIQIGVSSEPQVAATFLKDLPFWELGREIRNCDALISVDSLAQHLAWYVKKKSIVIFSISDPLIFGHPEHVNLLKNRDFLRPGWEQFNIYEGTKPRPEAFVSPEQVAATCRIFLDAQKESGEKCGHSRDGASAARIRS